jgi:hypothetical protein
MIQRDRTHANQHVARARLAEFDRLADQDLRATVR